MGVYGMPFLAVPGKPQQKTLCPGATICEHPELSRCVCVCARVCVRAHAQGGQSG